MILYSISWISIYCIVLEEIQKNYIKNYGDFIAQISKKIVLLSVLNQM
jgi:hypothetical protein